MAEKLYVCISLDVEEEGLFSGRYASRNPPLKNIPLLERLRPLISDLDFRLTLFCAYAVFADDAAWQTLARLASFPEVEIGAHLHHWSTPPWSGQGAGEPVRTHLLAPELLRKRLESLLSLGSRRLGQPITSFRMGRWDLKRAILPMLADLGIEVDSSICPLRAFKNGANHFLSPPDPYWVETPCGRILEAPITQLSLVRGLERFWFRLAALRPAWLDSYHFIGAVSANPVWHSLHVMKLATRLHYARGGRALNFFWHSSELMPGASPNVPDQAAADRLLKKIISFCEWLRENFNVEAVSASQLATLPIAAVYPVLAPSPDGDW